MKFQLRHGFYLVYLIIAILYITVLKLIGDNPSSIALPIIIFSDPTFIGFFFIGAILFFESEQKITEALFITPVSYSDYIISKAISLTILSTIVVIIITVAVKGILVNWISLIAGVTTTSMLFIFFGIFIANYFKSITSYMVVGGLLMSPFCSSLLRYFGLTDAFYMNIIPTTGSIELISNGFNNHLNPLYGIFYTIYLSILVLLMYKILVKKGGN